MLLLEHGAHTLSSRTIAQFSDIVLDESECTSNLRFMFLLSASRDHRFSGRYRYGWRDQLNSLKNSSAVFLWQGNQLLVYVLA